MTPNESTRVTRDRERELKEEEGPSNFYSCRVVFVRNVDNSRYRSSHRMQSYKPFRLRGSPRCVTPNAPVSLLLAPVHPPRFALTIYQPHLSLFVSLSPSSSSSSSSLALSRAGFNAVLQFQPHFCASLSLRANSDNTSRPYQTAVLIGVRIFFQAIQSFSQAPARCTVPLYDYA